MIRRLFSFYRLQLRLLWTWRPGRRALLLRIGISFVVGIAALTLTIWMVPGIHATGPVPVAGAFVVLSLLNLVVRPVLLALLAPFSPFALGLATIVFQMAAFVLIGETTPGITVDGPLPAVAASWVYAVVSVTFTSILSSSSDESYWGVLVRQLALSRRGIIRTDRPGVVIVQVDGLAHPVLTHQVRAGRVPFLSRWVRSGAMRLDRWTCLLPSQTSASQAGILHGNNGFIPAFRWWEKDRGRMMVSNRPEDAAEIGRRASDGRGLLAADGASIGNLVAGDAVRSYITASTIRDPSQGLGRSQTFFSFFASPYNYLHTIALTVGEVFKEYVQAARAKRNGVEPRMERGFPYPVARAATNVALRALATSLVLEEMFRGTPVIYVDYTDYDEIAHHSGPERAETLDALDGVDRVIRSLARAGEDTPRPYKFVVLSDHGQSLGATFRQRYGQTLQQVVAGLMGGVVHTHNAVDPLDVWGPIAGVFAETSQTAGATGALTRAMTRSSRAEAADADARRAADTTLPELVVAPSGNLAHVYFPRMAGRATVEVIERAWPGLVASLGRHPGIGMLMARSEAHGTVVIGGRGSRYLDGGRVEGDDPLAPYGEHATTGLRLLAGMEHCGDLVAISMFDAETDEVAAFEELIGSHGGIGGPQTEAFILHPAEWTVDEPLVGAEAVHRQLRRWLDGLGLGPKPLPIPDAASD